MSKEPRLVRVEWTDASHYSSERSPDEAQSITCTNSVTVGYLVKVHRDRVIVSMERHIDVTGWSCFRDTVVIPRGMVKRITYLVEEAK